MSLGSGGLAAQTRAVACPSTYDFGYTDYESYSGGAGIWINSIPFDFHVGTFDYFAYLAGASSGTYSFSNIISEDGDWVFANPTLGATCFQSGYWTTPMVDTVWTLQVTHDAQPGGTVQPLYNADDGGSTDTEGGWETCDYLVVADEYGNPLLDENGDYIVIANLGCQMD